MPCRERDIADALTTVINAGSYSRKVKAVRTWLPVWNLADLELLSVAVAPGLPTAAAQTRTEMLWSYPVVLGFGQQVARTDNSQIDEIADVVQEVVDYVKLDRVTLADGTTKASQTAVEYLRHADAEFLAEKSLFISLVQLTYRMVA